MRIDRHTFIISLSVLLAGCATKEQTYWEKGKHGSITVHHVRKTPKGTKDRTEQLTAKVIEPGMVHTYDLGRMPDGNGGMSEAHRYYRVVTSESFDLRLPPAGRLKPTGPKTVYTPPTYSPPPRDQRINDAVASANEAKDKLDAARGKVDAQLATDNNLRGELQAQSDQITELKGQLDAAMSAPQHTATPAPSATPLSDPLAQWGRGLK